MTAGGWVGPQPMPGQAAAAAFHARGLLTFDFQNGQVRH